MTYKKKLIEVALPLEAINKASIKENEPFTRYHPRGLHPWWARRSLATCRAVIFASLVDDPSSCPEKFSTEEAQNKERQRLFKLIEQLVQWENSNDENILTQARTEIVNSTGGDLPSVYDPFCGRGSIPLEAQRLGLEAHGSDLNPVAVLITQALIEFPPKFAGKAPVNPEAQPRIGHDTGWKGSAGLAADVRYYGDWMQAEAEKRFGFLYPKIKLPMEYGGNEITVIAWLWARTVKCPNPACGCEMPLVRSFVLSKKNGKEAWVEPMINKESKTVQFKVKMGKGKSPEGTVNRRGAKCICCDTAVPFDHVRTEGKAARMGARLMAIVAEAEKGRIYVDAAEEHEKVLEKAKPSWRPDSDLPYNPRNFQTPNYGMTTFADIFTPRQLVILSTLSDLVGEVWEKVRQAALAADIPEDGNINNGGRGATAYADAVTTYLGLAVSKWADFSNSICSWNITNQNMTHLFARQAIPMSWDYAELNPFSSLYPVNNVTKNISEILLRVCCEQRGYVCHEDATRAGSSENNFLIVTDPPYYNNISYADLSDFFYVWLRRSLGKVHPSLFNTMLVPKSQELVASPYRFGGDKIKAKDFFENGFHEAFVRMRELSSSVYPICVYYAVKQTESEDGMNGDDLVEDRSSTGWETMLEGMIKAGFSIVGTWPMRSERAARMISIGTNALASCIVLVCRPRSDDAITATRKDFLTALRRELNKALSQLKEGNIAPVDLAQATIGPGMSIFSRYAKILEADGQSMAVRTALQIINQELDAWLVQQEGVMDQETRFCVSWYEQFGLGEAVFGEADVLARAKNTAVQRLDDLGLLSASKGKVRLLTRDELPEKWIPSSSSPIWLCTQHLVRALAKGGEAATASLAQGFAGDLSDSVKSLAYRLFAIADRKKWTEEALAYNALIASWSDVQLQVLELTGRTRTQSELF